MRQRSCWCRARDQAQLDLNTSFALFFPEKRPFFLEGADYFTTPLQVLYTRQIADPDYGLRATDQALYAVPVIEHSRDIAAQLLYSYKVNPRTAFYAGYSEGGFSDDRIRDIFSNTRSVFLKVSYAWQPG